MYSKESLHGTNDAIALAHLSHPDGSRVRGRAPPKRASAGDGSRDPFDATAGRVRDFGDTSPDRHASRGSFGAAALRPQSFQRAARPPGAARHVRSKARRADRAGPLGPWQRQRKVRRARDALGERPPRGSRMPLRRRVRGHFLGRELHPLAADKGRRQAHRVPDAAVRQPDERSVPEGTRPPPVRERLLRCEVAFVARPTTKSPGPRARASGSSARLLQCPYPAATMLAWTASSVAVEA